MSVHHDPKNHIDAFLPAEMARKAEEVGVQKAALPASTMFVLAILAGAFIALGAQFSITVSAGASEQIPYGLVKLLSGLAFCLGLILVVVAGAELFTGNNLVVMALASGKLGLMQLLRGWIIVYAGNFLGAIATAILIFVSNQYQYGSGAVGESVLVAASAKCELTFVQAIALGMLCNALVCLAIWLCFSARSTTDKILSILFPITAFVACGFEHCVANMYVIPKALLVRAFAPEEFWNSIGASAGEFDALTWGNFFLVNLVPVTVGNIVGGSVMVGLVYWFVHLRKRVDD